MSFITESIRNKIKKLLGNSSKKFAIKSQTPDGTLQVFQAIDPDKGQPLEPNFDDFRMRDKFLDIIEEIMKNKGQDFELELKFKRSIITTQIHRDGTLALRSIEPNSEDVKNEQMEGMIVAYFDGEKPFPLKQWLLENVLTEDDVIELEKSLIYLV